MKNYYVASNAGWFVVRAHNAKAARREGVREWGRGYVREVREATADEAEYIRNVKGEISEAES